MLLTAGKKNFMVQVLRFSDVRESYVSWTGATLALTMSARSLGYFPPFFIFLA